MLKRSKLAELIESILLSPNTENSGVEDVSRKCLCKLGCPERYTIIVYKYNTEEYRHTILPHPNMQTNYYEKERVMRKSVREKLDKF